MKLCVTKLDFSEKKFFLPQIEGKWAKIGLFEFFEKFGHKFLLNLFYNEIMKIYINFIQENFCCRNISQNVLNQIAGCFNQPYLESKSMKQPNSLVDTNSSKLEVDQNFFGRGHGQKWMWPVWPWDSKTDFICRMNKWNKLVFCMLVQIQES